MVHGIIEFSTYILNLYHKQKKFQAFVNFKVFFSPQKSGSEALDKNVYRINFKKSDDDDDKRQTEFLIKLKIELISIHV